MSIPGTCCTGASNIDGGWWLSLLDKTVSVHRSLDISSFLNRQRRGRGDRRTDDESDSGRILFQSIGHSVPQLSSVLQILLEFSPDLEMAVLLRE